MTPRFACHGVEKAEQSCWYHVALVTLLRLNENLKPYLSTEIFDIFCDVNPFGTASTFWRQIAEMSG